MEGPTQQEPTSPKVRDRIETSFDRQGLMTHLGARLTHCRPLLVKRRCSDRALFSRCL